MSDNLVIRAKSDSLSWHSTVTASGLLVQWRRGLADLKVKISGKLTSALANSEVLITLPPEAVAGTPTTYIQVSRCTSLVKAAATVRLMTLETDGRIRNTAGLSFAAGQYLFADHTVPYK